MRCFYILFVLQASIIHTISSSIADCVFTGLKQIEGPTEYKEAFKPGADPRKCFEERTGFGCYYNGSFITLKQDCVCSYHQLKEGLRPEGFCYMSEDAVNNIKCEMCKENSKNGPCLKGSLPDICPDILAQEIKCNCTPGYEGAFCDMEKVTLACTNIKLKSNDSIRECNESDLKMPCLTNGAIGTNLTFLCRSIFNGENNLEACQKITKITRSSSEEHSKQQSITQNKTTMIAVTVPSVILVVIIGGAVVLTIRYRRKKRRRDGPTYNHESNPLSDGNDTENGL